MTTAGSPPRHWPICLRSGLPHSTPITTAHRETAALFESPQWIKEHFNPRLGITRNVLGGQLYSKVSASIDRPPIDYAVGAALCIRRDLLEEAGIALELFLGWIPRP